MTRKVSSGVGNEADANADTGEFPSVRRAAGRKRNAGGMTDVDSGSFAIEDTGTYPSYAPITITSPQPLVSDEMLQGKGAEGARGDSASPLRNLSRSVEPVTKARPKRASDAASRGASRDSGRREGGDVFGGGVGMTVLLWIAVVGVILAMVVWWVLPHLAESHIIALPSWLADITTEPGWKEQAVEYIPLLIGATIVILLLGVILRHRVLAAICLVCIVLQLACGIGYFVANQSSGQASEVFVRPVVAGAEQ